jgi:hypothetical protein
MIMTLTLQIGFSMWSATPTSSSPVSATDPRDINADRLPRGGFWTRRRKWKGTFSLRPSSPHFSHTFVTPDIYPRRKAGRRRSPGGRREGRRTRSCLQRWTKERLRSEALSLDITDFGREEGRIWTHSLLDLDANTYSLLLLSSITRWSSNTNTRASRGSPE